MAWVRLLTCSFPKMLLMCRLTVLTVSTSSSAISRFVAPSAISRSTCTSRSPKRSSSGAAPDELSNGETARREVRKTLIERVAAVYRTFKSGGKPDAVPGFCRVTTLDEVRKHNYALTPGRFVGSPAGDDDDDAAFEERTKRLKATLTEQFQESAQLEQLIQASLDEIE
jgi:hypothetical protein